MTQDAILGTPFLHANTLGLQSLCENQKKPQLPTQKALYQGTTLVVPKTSPNDGLYMPRKNALYEGHGFSRAVQGSN
jgi:hypothetical protein